MINTYYVSRDTRSRLLPCADGARAIVVQPSPLILINFRLRH